MESVWYDIWVLIWCVFLWHRCPFLIWINLNAEWHILWFHGVNLYILFFAAFSWNLLAVKLVLSGRVLHLGPSYDKPLERSLSLRRRFWRYYYEFLFQEVFLPVIQSIFDIILDFFIHVLFYCRSVQFATNWKNCYFIVLNKYVRFLSLDVIYGI
jgi:hypothetical protein